MTKKPLASSCPSEKSSFRSPTLVGTGARNRDESRARGAARQAVAALVFALMTAFIPAAASAAGPVIILKIEGTINPATADYLAAGIREAEAKGASALVVEINTPGGLLPSMRTMVEAMLQSKVPVVSYVSPQGAGALSAGVFITMAAHVAVMAPGTQIGAAHPVIGNGNDIQGDMRQKIENSAVSLIKAIAEQRGRNGVWGERAVRESVSLTDSEAMQEKVIDFVAADLERLLVQLEGRTITVQGEPRTFQGVATAPRELRPMSFKQSMVNFLADPNIAVLLGLGVVLGFGLELLHPGAILPGIVGFICLVLSLVAGQILPISQGGIALLVLGALLFIAELFIPAFGVCGIAGVVCVVLGAIYFIEPGEIWGEGLTVNRTAIGVAAAAAGTLMMLAAHTLLRTRSQAVVTGREGLLGKEVTVIVPFALGADGALRGRVRVMGELWHATYAGSSTDEPPQTGDHLIIEKVDEGMTLMVRRK